MCRLYSLYMKRKYPLFTIDRSKQNSFPYDFITCYDNEVGFIARVIFFPVDEPYYQLLANSDKIPEAEHTFIKHKFKKGGMFIQIEDFLYQFDWTNDNKKRIATLLKRALKKYLHAEVDRTAHKDLSIDEQIKQQELTIERAKAHYDELLKRSLGDKKIADYQIALAEATLDSLKQLKDYTKLINLN